MHSPIETVSETIGFDEQTRSLYSLEAFKAREKGTVLMHFYHYWVTLPIGQGGIPHEDVCRPKEHLPPNVAARVSWIDTSAEDPQQFIVRDHVASTIPGLGIELSDRPLCDIPALDMHTTACAVEYLFCKHERTPMYHEIEQLISGLKRHYTRIMLPVMNDAGDVNRIYYATRQIEPVKRVSFHVVGESRCMA